MRKNLFLSTALLLIISLIAVSCAPANLQNSADPDTIQVYFGNLEAKAIDETAYTPTGTTSGGASEVKIGDVNSYYWSYKATKNDSLFSQGQTDGFVNCADETGLGDAKTFSKGKWLFELRAYASKDDRRAGTQYLFSGTNESIASNNKDTILSSSTTISIPVTYSYIAGEGTASFNYTVTIDQDTLTGHKTYEITGVNAIIDSEKKVALTKGSNNVWSASETGLASGVKTIGIEVFVDSETTARASTDKLTSAIILHGMTTKISGKATVTLKGATMTIDFNGTSLPSEQPTEDAFKTKVGDIIEMGTYPTTYTNNSGTSTSAGTYANQPVSWKVLAVDETNNRALVISEKVLTFMKPYTAATSSNYTSYTYSWTGCDINTYLNGTFITEYGLSDVSMASVEHETEYYTFAASSSDGKQGTNTKSSEKVFLLSVTEVKKYFAKDTARVAYNLAGSAAYWWLRSPGSLRCYFVAFVSDFGSVYTDGVDVFSLGGLRPAFWINL